MTNLVEAKKVDVWFNEARNNHHVNEKAWMTYLDDHDYVLMDVAMVCLPEGPKYDPWTNVTDDEVWSASRGLSEKSTSIDDWVQTRLIDSMETNVWCRTDILAVRREILTQQMLEALAVLDRSK